MLTFFTTGVVGVSRCCWHALAADMLTCFTALLQVSWVSAVGDLVLPDDKVDLNTLSREQVSDYS
jgi:hypothetical protein